jgi:hypothetical protein
MEESARRSKTASCIRSVMIATEDLHGFLALKVRARHWRIGKPLIRVLTSARRALKTNVDVMNSKKLQKMTQ